MTYQRKSKPTPSRMLPRAALAIGVFALISVVWPTGLFWLLKPFLELLYGDNSIGKLFVVFRILDLMPWLAAAGFIGFFYTRRNR